MKLIVIISFLIYGNFVVAQTFKTKFIHRSGDINKRINLVILPDGYQEHEMHKFVKDTRKFKNKFFSEKSFNQYKDYFNIIVIKVPSNESGATHPGTAIDVVEPKHPIKYVDNYFGSTFDYYNIHRLLTYTNEMATTNVLANNAPYYDIGIIMVNTDYYGGSGGGIAITNRLNYDIAMHELGHSFANLADEYYPGDIYAREKKNMTQETNPSRVKWKNWYGKNGIGIYQHCCGGQSSYWYRPHQKCKMRKLGMPFCSVCTEAIVEKIHSLISPIDSYYPNNNHTVNSPLPKKFKLKLIKPTPNTLNVQWKLNGKPLKNTTDHISIPPQELNTGENQLMAVVYDDTKLIKVDNHETIHAHTVRWTINYEDRKTKKIAVKGVSANEIIIELFPNPTPDILNIKMLNKKAKDIYRVDIYTVSGKKVKTKTIDNLGINKIDLNSLRSGIYIVTFYSNNHLILSKRIIKQ